MIYCDTSFLFSLYVEDSGSPRASKQVATATEPLVWTSWHQLEFTAALEARVGRKANPRKDADAIYGVLKSHLEKEKIYVSRSLDWAGALSRASALARKSGGKFACRSLDILHVCICQELAIKKFWTLDDRQRNLAKSVGLAINKA